VTDAVIAEILDWHRHHESCVQLARRLGVSTSTVRNVIRSGGQHYKTPSPEHRGSVLPARRHRRDSPP
jgi:transposase-like protein